MRYRTIFAFLACAAALSAQTAPLPTVDVDLQVHYLNADTVRAKYGRLLPKSIYAGSVTGTNKGASNVVFGQGYVLQVLRSRGFPALSQQDARAIVLKSQGTGVRAVWNKFSPVGLKILDNIEALQVLKVVAFGTPAAAALVTADAVAKVVQPDLAAVLAQVYQDYDADGIQPLMQLAPGGSLVGTLLFETEGAKPAAGSDATITVAVPVLSK